MAAGDPPDNFGGNHALMDDPENAGLSNIIRDMAALNLQLLHFVRATADPADRPRVERIADGVRRTLNAGTATQNRERATRELRPITRIPDVDYGANANLAHIRLHNTPSFTGASNDPNDVIRWLARVTGLAQSNQLTLNATVLLLIQASSGGAADYIEQMRDENRNLAQIVQQLEMRYGDLCSPEEARVKCNNMLRKEKESLPEFIDRLRYMSRMATRYIDDDAARRQAIDQLVEGNIRRVLPTSVRNALEERVINRSRMGLPAFTAREIEKECLDLERRRDERRHVVQEPVAARRHARVLQHVNLASEPFGTFTDEDFSSADEIDTDDEATYHLVNEIKQQERKYVARGQPIDPQRVYKKAFRRFNDRHPPPKFPRYNNQGNYGARQAGIVNAPGYNNPVPVPTSPPNRLDQQVRRTVIELLTLANCTRGHCIQCGVEGHYMHADACALKDKPLVDRPCAKCGTGLHSADFCPRVYQQPYVAPPKPAVQANVAEIEDLNGN